MQKPAHPPLILSLLFVGLIGVGGASVMSSEARAQDWEVDGGDARQAEIMRRYKSMLESNPVEGLAFNRLLQQAGRGRGLDALITEYRRKVEGRPERLNYRLILGHFLKAKGEIEGALAEYEKAVELAPNQSLPWLSRGSAYLLKGERALAGKDFEKALELEKNRDRQQEILRHLADISFEQRDFERAEVYFDRLVALEPGNEHLRQEYAQVLVQYRRWEKALEQYEVLLRLAGGNTELRATTLRDLGDVYEQKGDGEKALQTYTQAMGLIRGQSWLVIELQSRIVSVYRSRNRLPDFIETYGARWRRGSYEQMILVADVLTEIGEADEALALYRRASGRNPRAADTRLKIIRILERKGDDQGVIRAYQDLIRVAPTRYQYQFDLARHYMRIGDRRRAEQTLDTAGRRFARDGYIQVMLADMYMRYGLGEKAGAIYERLLRLDPRDETYILSLGEYYYQDGQRQKALDTWKKLVDSRLGKADGHARLGEILVDRGMVEQGIGHLQKALELAPDELRYRRMLAQAFERGRRWDRAIETWEELLAEASQPHMASEARGRIIDIHRRQNRLRARMRDFAEAFAQTEPDMQSGYFLAESHLRLQEYDSAEEVFRRLLELERARGETGVQALLALERIYSQTAKFEEALKTLEEIVALRPDQARDLYQRMAELSLKLFHEDEAIAYAQMAIEQNPDDAAAQARLGELYRSMRRLELAAGQYRTAFDLDPRAHQYAMELAEVLRVLGDMAEAERLYRTVLTQSHDESLAMRSAKRAMDMAQADGRLFELEGQISPLLYRSPPRPVYRRILLELYGRASRPLVFETRYGVAEAQREAARSLEEMGQRALPLLIDALQSEDINQRSSALRMLTDWTTTPAAPVVARLIDDEREALRIPAMVAAARLGDPRAAGPLLKALDDPSPQIRDLAVWALGHVRAESAVARLSRLLEPENASAQRALAAMSLGRIASPAAVDSLLTHLGRLDTGPRDQDATRAVIWGLGRSGDVRAVEPLLMYLEAASPEVLPWVVWAVARLSDERVVEGLFEAMWGAGQVKREAAIVGLFQRAEHHGVDDRGGAEIFEELPYVNQRRGGIQVSELLGAWGRRIQTVPFVDTTPFITAHKETIIGVARRQITSSERSRKSVVSDLVGGDGRLHLGPLTARRAPTLDDEARRRALLSEIATALLEPLEGSDPVAFTLLAERLDSGLGGSALLKKWNELDAGQRRQAVLALHDRKTDADGFQILMKAVADPAPAVRSAAAGVMATAARRGAVHDEGLQVEALKALCHDPYTGVRVAAIDALGAIGSPAATETLAELLEENPSFHVRTVILEALSHIDDPASRAILEDYRTYRGVELRRSTRP
ncbi:MAG: HEAT repeat domain-containing protein [Bradymonadaceae bacterium]